MALIFMLGFGEEYLLLNGEVVCGSERSKRTVSSSTRTPRGANKKMNFIMGPPNLFYPENALEHVLLTMKCWAPFDGRKLRFVDGPKGKRATLQEDL